MVWLEGEKEIDASEGREAELTCCSDRRGEGGEAPAADGQCADQVHREGGGVEEVVNRTVDLLNS